MSLQVGQQGTATATFNAPLQSGATVNWTSSDQTIAKVSGNPFSPGNQQNSAVVTAIGAGTCNISCSVTNPDNVVASGSAVQTVTPAPQPDVTTVSVVTP